MKYQLEYSVPGKEEWVPVGEPYLSHEDAEAKLAYYRAHHRTAYEFRITEVPDATDLEAAMAGVRLDLEACLDQLREPP